MFMDEATTEEEFDEKAWLELKTRIFDNPRKRREWADQVIDSWIRRRSRRSRKPRNAPRAPNKANPESCRDLVLDEIEALNIVLELKAKLALG